MHLVDNRILVPERVADSAPIFCAAEASDFSHRLHAPDRIRRLGRQGACAESCRARSKCPPRSRSSHSNASSSAACPFPQRNLEICLLRAVRIEADGHQNAVAVPRRGFAEVKNVVVKGIVESKAQMRLQRGFCLAQPVQLRDFSGDVAGRIPVSRFDFVLFGIEIFLAAGQRRRLAQFETLNTCPTGPTGLPPAPRE